MTKKKITEVKSKNFHSNLKKKNRSSKQKTSIQIINKHNGGSNKITSNRFFKNLFFGIASSSENFQPSFFKKNFPNIKNVEELSVELQEREEEYANYLKIIQFLKKNLKTLNIIYILLKFHLEENSLLRYSSFFELNELSGINDNKLCTDLLKSLIDRNVIKNKITDKDVKEKIELIGFHSKKATRSYYEFHPYFLKKYNLNKNNLDKLEKVIEPTCISDVNAYLEGLKSSLHDFYRNKKNRVLIEKRREENRLSKLEKINRKLDLIRGKEYRLIDFYETLIFDLDVCSSEKAAKRISKMLRKKGLIVFREGVSAETTKVIIPFEETLREGNEEAEKEVDEILRRKPIKSK